MLTRANTIAHEMAHMWFGDLVTMRWWDDLWLNESFAEYMGYRTVVEATEFTDAWVDFGVARKAWGYAADRAPVHPPGRRAPAPDAASALQNFDGISYAKGASALRQLVACIGDEAFLAGVREHLRAHAYGNGDLADFLAAMESASGRSLTAWTAAWLRTAGVDRLAVERRRARPHPAAGAPGRPPAHARRRRLHRRAEVLRVDIVAEGERTHVPGLGAGPPARWSCRMPATSPGRRCRSTPRRWPPCRPGWPTCPTPRPAPCSGSRCWERSTVPR